MNKHSLGEIHNCNITIVKNKYCWVSSINSSPLVPHIYASMNCDSTASDNGLLPARRQAIIWTNAGLLSIGPLGTIFGQVQTKKHYNFHSLKRILKHRLRNGVHFSGGEELKLTTIEMFRKIRIWLVVRFAICHKLLMSAQSSENVIS